MSSTTDRRPLSFLVMTGSRRADSFNTKLARLAVDAVEANGASAAFATIRDFEVPDYDGDAERSDGIPPGAERFRERLNDVDALVIASPEYNASVPGVVKNLIDWASRFRPQPFNELQVLLLSASPSMVGGNRGLWALRVPLEHLGARVYPDMFSLAAAHTQLGEDGRIADETLRERFEANIVNFMNLVEAATHYPCVKKAWVEYLGERPDPAFDRIQAETR
ncbi:NADPH-dependent FMN reductase [Streptomyces thermolilacinus]|uniref:NADPH-dependent FMN reductase n=1 Tax=Streptomyces thermolilacinus SPC6 TaxID=1306406 RepID=A0A1D3DM93_9ACTN|nr:NAD(P)H-dependent oxidoreductase [Streptomyces thermolilacinus]OEJ93449.1 NADPH-dependent FMN reductase [Streptomyces thermolilacinus SPC6]